MNKIFKVIYSKAKHMKVVVSEIAKSNSKSTVSDHTKKLLYLTFSAFMALNCVVGSIDNVGASISYGSSNRNNYDLSRLTSSQQNMLKNGLFLGITEWEPYVDYDTGEYGYTTYHSSYDTYLVYNTSSKSYQVICVTAGYNSSTKSTSYGSWTVMSDVSAATAAKLGLAMPTTDSSGNQTLTRDTNVTANKNLTVKGSTSLGNTTVSGNLNVSGNTVSNVKAGTADTDAANVGQVKNLIAQSNTYSVNYDGDFGSVTLQGEGGTTITNLKDGALSATSTDAVSGKQLYKTNQDVSKVQQSLTATNTTISGIQDDITGIKSTNKTISDDLNTVKSQVSGGFNVLANNGKVKTVTPDSKDLNFVNGDDISITGNDDGSLTIGVKATGTVSSGDTHVVTGGTMYSELRPTDGNYIKQTNTTAANLTSLDAQLAQVAKDLGIETTNRTNADTTLTNNLNQEIQDRTTAVSDLTTKLNDEIANRTADVNDLTSKIAQEKTDRESAISKEVSDRTTAISDLKKTFDTSTAEIQDKLNRLSSGEVDSSAAETWGEKIATGSVTEGDKKAISGDTLRNEVRPTTDGTYIKNEYTTGANLTALDTQLRNTTNNLANLSAVSVNYDSVSHDIVTLDGQFGTRLTGVKAGSLSATSKDAVNGSQLYATNQNLASFANDVQDTRDWVASLSDSVTAVNKSSSAVSRYMDTIDASKADKSLNNLTDAGKLVISNAARDAVQDYIGQLQKTLNADEIKARSNASPVATLEAPTVTSSGSSVSYDDDNSSTITLAGAEGTTVDNVKDGNLSASSKQAVNGSQLYAVRKSLTDQSITLGNLTADVSDIKTKNADISTTLNTLNTQVSAGFTVTANGTRVKNVNPTDNTINVTGSDLVNVTAKNGSLNIDVKADGKVEKGNTSLVTGGAVWDKLNDMNSTVTDIDDKIANTASKDGSNLSADEVKSWQDKLGTGTVKAGDSGLVTGDAVNDAINKSVGAVASDVKGLKDASGLTEDNVKSWQEKLGNGTITTGDTGLVTGGSVADAINKSVGSVAADVGGLKDASGLSDANVKSWQEKLGNGTITSGDTGLVTGGSVADAIDKSVGAVSSDLDKLKDASNLSDSNVKSWQEKLGTGEIKEGDTGLVTGGNVYDAIKDITIASSPVTSEGDTINIGKNNDKATKIDVSGKDENGDAVNRTITGVKVDPTDLSSAANVGYVNSVAAGMAEGFGQALNSTANRLTQNMNKIGAGAAALAALHPGDFDPEDKWDFATGVGHYKNANATALGVYYHPSEDTLISLGATLGNGNAMMNAGLSFKLGSGSGTNTMSRAQMSKVIKQDREAMKVMVNNMIQMKQEIEDLKGRLTIDPNKKASFPDVPAGHWAKDAVETLKGNGDVEGYPDGKFHGNRKMTRYEYAQMLFNALKKGNPVKEEVIKEYAPELRQILKENQNQEAKQQTKQQKQSAKLGGVKSK